jgi:4-hydroxybenzoate polyprenyltransferase
MRLLDYFFAARPLLQLPIWTVYLVALHYHHQLSGERFAGIDLAIMAGLSLIFTGAVYLNQVFDFETDRINQKVGFLQRGLLSQVALMRGCLVCLVLPLALAPLVSWLVLFVAAQLVVLAIVYSASPMRLKDRPIGGLLANAYGHGFLVAVAVMPHMTLHNSGLLGWDNPFYFFLAVGATYVLTTIPDRIGDAAAGKRTLAVVLGRNGALWLALALLGLADLIAWRSGFLLLSLLAVMAVLFVLATLLLKNEASVRFASKMPLLLLTLLAGFWYPVYLVFVVALLIGTRAYYRRRFGLTYPELA